MLYFFLSLGRHRPDERVTGRTIARQAGQDCNFAAEQAQLAAANIEIKRLKVSHLQRSWKLICLPTKQVFFSPVSLTVLKCSSVCQLSNPRIASRSFLTLQPSSIRQHPRRGARSHFPLSRLSSFLLTHRPCSSAVSSPPHSPFLSPYIPPPHPPPPSLSPLSSPPLLLFRHKLRIQRQLPTAARLSSRNEKCAIASI